MLRDHRKSQLELRMQLGRGKHEPDALVFCDHEGAPISAELFQHNVATGDLTKLRTAPSDVPCAETFSRLGTDRRGIDVVKVSRRLGHSSPVITLSTYAHLFSKDDDGAAAAIEAVLG